MNQQLKAEYDMNDSWSWSYESKCYEELKVVDDMNNSNSLALAIICYA